jgi:hypothetical protein
MQPIPVHRIPQVRFLFWRRVPRSHPPFLRRQHSETVLVGALCFREVNAFVLLSRHAPEDEKNEFTDSDAI